MDHDLVLRHEEITLRPLRPEDAADLLSMADAELWAGMATPLPRDEEQMREHLQELIERPEALAFAVERDGAFVGRTTYYDLQPGLRAEIGNTMYDRTVWGTRVNPAAKLLLLEHAFSARDQGGLGVGRVALRCDHRNQRSFRAIERLGARFEGTLRRYRPAADGTVADVDYFSVLAEEWPAVRDGLRARLAD